MSVHATPFPRRSLLSLALALAVLPAQAGEVTVEQLAQRLQALEQRLGVAAATDADSAGLADLDQRLRVIERKLELQAEESAAKAASTPTVTLDGKGLAVKSPGNSGFELKLHGLVQGDGRFYLDDEQKPQNDGFLLRYAEPTIEGSFGPLLGFKLQAQLAGDSATVNDAYLDLRFDPRATVRVGKFKQPFGLEQLQSSSVLEAIERGLPSELVPARDIGVQLHGALAGGTLNYAVGVFNGGVDGRDAASRNPDNELEATGRVFWEPFKNSANAWSGFGVGLAASVADTFGSGDSFLPRYRTPGQVQFFGYRAETAADGLHRRWSPQAYYYNGPFGVQAEYVASEQEVRVTSGANAGRVAHLENTAWQLLGSWVLTGEDASYKGVARPNHPFTAGAAGWGAFELVTRYGELDIDDDAFPLFANPATAGSGIEAWSLGLNWYLTQNLKLAATYTQSTFEGGAAAGADREDEKTVFTRAQISF
ncbi:OprO/OprP family phosphate-selective porin [Lysobacter solisilvae (ex Woo and Kim 2022)]|uniref:Porin n=1 Tax=Agrilutibacter terrestris TaxID=2865112 RepID=A0A7H0FU24_9GAMM|nr:porin [Lysobacter terrestris]QNP39540.1 porin [Lysobacter terrestris]